MLIKYKKIFEQAALPTDNDKSVSDQLMAALMTGMVLGSNMFFDFDLVTIHKQFSEIQ